MKIAVQRVLLCLWCCAGLSGCAVFALADVGPAAAASPTVGGVGLPVAGERSSALAPLGSLASPFAQTTVLTPEQLSADAASRTEFGGLGRDAAVALAEQDFAVARPSWTAPGSEDGGQIETYLGEDSAVEKLPGGQHAVVSSTLPLRVDNGSGLAPVSLALRDDGEAYVPGNPLVPVAISDHAAGGVAFPAGLSVAPVSAAASEAPVVVGDRVVFANVAQDTDLMAEPRPSGAEFSWQLRSHESPQDEALAFHLPPGAVLRASASVVGGVEVLEEGEPVLLVPPAVARDASGAPVPVSYSVSGSVLTTHVDLSGTVAFPVLVDPELHLFYGFYGGKNGANVWTGWQHGGYSGFGVEEAYNLLKIGSNPGEGVGAYGSLTIFAPGPAGKAGSAGITRVDLVGVANGVKGQSRLVATINESNGPKPVYSFNPTVGATGPEPLYEGNELAGQTIAFCASGAGGHDGGEPGLCDEVNYQGRSFLLEDEITGAPQNHFNWVQMEGADVIYRDPAEPNRVVIDHGGYEGQWLKTGPTNFTIIAEDEGLGIAHLELQVPAGHEATFKQNIACNSPYGFTGCPNAITSEKMNLSGLKGTGEFSLAPVAIDAAENVARPSASYVPLYLDQTAPVIGELFGPLGQAAGGVIGSGNYTLNFDPVDGSKASPQSGVRSVEVKVDGRQVYTKTTTCATPKGVPAEGCFDLSGNWTMNGASYGAGAHTITVVAKDWVGNESSKSIVVTVNEAAYEPVGPGAANLETGDLKLNPTDVALSGGAASLSVSRTYDSRNTSQGATGPLGPQWALSLPDSAAAGEWQSLTVLPEGSVAVLDAHGNQIVFTPKTGGGYNSPSGYQADTLSEPSTSPVIYQVNDAAGDYTKFTQPSSGAPFVPSSVAQASAAGGLNKVTYTFTKTAEGITEPTEVLAPEPSEGACTSTLVKGCRALTFNYATTKTATGEGPSEWGDYIGRLTRVYFTAWDPAKGEMSPPVTVAQYAYDLQGRLRAEWDPRLASPLKTTYGYDSENHVTAVSAPGQQPWLLNYGTSTGDANAGRLLSVSRPPAETVLWKGEALKNTGVPVLSGPADTGIKMSVGNGTWSGGALAYGYEWEDCNTSGGECAPIAGATNPAYTPAPSDLGHTLVAQVTATSASGSISASSAHSATIGEAKPTYASQFGSLGSGNGQLKGPRDVVLDGKGNLWVVDTGNNRVEEFNEKGEYVKAFGTEGSGNGQLKSPQALAIDAKGNVWVVDNGNSRVEEFNEKGEYQKAFGSQGSGNGQFEYPNGIAIDAKGNVWVVDTYDYRVEVFNEKGEYQKAFGNSGQMSMAAGIALDAHGNAWIADGFNKRVDEYNEKGEYLKSFGTGGKGAGELELPKGITIDGQGHIWVADGENERVAEFTEKGEYIAEFGAKGSGAGQFHFSTAPALVGIAADAKHDVWVNDGENNRVEKWTTPTVSEGEAPPVTVPRWTLDYQVPVSGPEAPYALGAKEVEAWAQKDHPADATAVFPPDESQSWPATDYKRASIFYMDSANRTVNTASPSGAISTIEYDAHDNVERTLGAEDRSKALEAGSKSAEESRLLDTQSSYSSDATELTSTLGPQHTVKLANGSEAAARKHTQYFYDEGSPGGETYRLLTKTVEGAQITSQEEKDKRTVTTAYNGQENLGWKLHAPTSTTTTITGSETLTSSTSYEPSTGEVKETHAPSASPAKPAVYASQFGSFGMGNGQLREPDSVAVDAKGNLWVLDSGNCRVEEFNEKGEYLQKFGSEGTGNGQFLYPKGIALDSKGDVLVVGGNSKAVQEFNEKGEFVRSFGQEGSGTEQLSNPLAIAVDTKGNVSVADTNHSRIVEFGEKGEYKKAIGTSGSGAGQMRNPAGITIDPYGNAWVADKGNNRVDVFNEKGEYAKEIGAEGTGNGQFKEPSGIASDANGDIWVGDRGNTRIEELNNEGEYLSSFGSKGSGAGQFSFSTVVGITTDTKHDLWVADTVNNRIDKWTTPVAFFGRPGAHTTQTIYYTAAENSTHPNCGNHPEWASLPCQGQHAAQPESGLPNLPVTTYTYNIWNEPLTTTDTVGSTTRTTTIGYDSAGRPETSAISSSVDTAVPTVTNEYNTETGALKKQSNTEGKSLTSEYNTLGQPIAYTDADGNTTTYEYEKEKDYRLLKTNDGKGTQTLTYEPTTGFLSSLKDSAAGTFTAGRDIEGNIVTEGYPNGMTATYTRNQTGTPVGLEYVKTTHCTSGCTWYSDTITPSIHGQWLSQTSTLSKQNYRYDEIGRLTEVQDTPAGKGCTTRLYAFDEDSNRTSQTSREPGSEGKCATEGGTTQTWPYDTSDRLDETGVTYDTFGNTTSLPATDAGGSPLISSYYVNDRLASQEQNGEAINYKLDPAGRIRETTATGTTKATTISHYAGASDSPAWTEAAGSWTRNIGGIGGGLAAIQANGGTPVLQLANLHGDIIATAELSETETKLRSTSDTTEYGVPRTSTPAKYSWLGAAQRPTELPTGIISMGARGYIPQLGRFEQTDPQPGGSANAYAYTMGDPVNGSDPSGEWTSTTSYNYGAAETGQAQAGLPEAYSGPGAIAPPPVNMQIEEEFNAHPPWDAVFTFTLTLGGGGHGAHTAGLSLSSAFAKFKHIIGENIEDAVQAVKTRATQIWDAVNSVIFEKAYECINGADELTQALDAAAWAKYPLFTATASLVGCAGALQGADYGGTGKTGKF